MQHTGFAPTLNMDAAYTHSCAAGCAWCTCVGSASWTSLQQQTWTQTQVAWLFLSPALLCHLPAQPLPLQEVSKAQAANRARLDAEYRRLVDNLVEAQQLRGGEEWLSNPTLPEDVVQESMPGRVQHGGAAACVCTPHAEGFCRVQQ